MKVCVIGGGPSGMIAACESAKQGATVTLFEKNEKTGKKLYITGKGRCNLTNDCDEQEFLQNVLRNPKFMYSCIYSFNSEKAMEYFEALGLKLKVERGNRVFPISDKSGDVLDAFNRNLKRNNVKVLLNSVVDGVQYVGDGFEVEVNDQKYKFDKVIVATGGITYKSTGSTGDGYQFAKSFSHTILPPKGALIEIKIKDKLNLQGLSLKNVTLSAKRKGKEISSEFGEMLFTADGISGPIVLTTSSKIVRENLKDIKLEIDLKPALSFEQLDARVLRDFEKSMNKSFKMAIADLLPSRLIHEVIEKTGIDENKKVNIITSKERETLVKTLKGFELTPSSFADDNMGIITVGGVKTSEVDPKSMQSKLQKGLYFCGEVLDVDGKTGGFNLQIAMATGYVAGNSILQE